ncbi:MAG: PAS domain S-box protein [Gemmatimonadaceae bacterium]
MTTPTAPRSTEGEMLQSLIDVAPQAIVAVDLDWHVTRWNRAAEALFGWTAEEIIGQPLLYVPPEQQAEFKRMQQQLNAGKSLGVVETVRQHKDGHEVSVLRAVSVLRDSEGRPVSYVAVLTDLTERKQLEEQLRHAQKMEAIGCLAGGVAHDFNNMLTVIASCAAMMRQRPHSEEDSEDLEAIATSAERAAALTRQLLLFSRKQATTLFKVDANQIVAEMEPMLRRLLRENIALETSVSKDEALVTADPTQLQQVILNLFVNAADAMPDGGALTIETAVVSVDPDRVRAHPRAKGGTHLHLRVRDTGIGMDATTMARIFEPFFTTKPLGKDGDGARDDVRRGRATRRTHSASKARRGKGASFTSSSRVPSPAPPPRKVPAAATHATPSRRRG